MSEYKQLDNLLRHAELQERKARLAWLASRQKLLLAQQQLAELERYAQEYSVGRNQNQQRSGALNNHHHFSQRLSDAVQQQAQALGEASQLEAQSLQGWQEKRRQLEARKLMQQRRMLTHHQRELRREQNQQDEMAGLCQGAARA